MFRYIIDRTGRAQYVVRRHAPRLSREFIAAARPANTFQYPVTHQRLQYRLQMPWRHAMAGREGLC